MLWHCEASFREGLKIDWEANFTMNEWGPCWFGTFQSRSPTQHHSNKLFFSVRDFFCQFLSIFFQSNLVTWRRLCGIFTRPRWRLRTNHEQQQGVCQYNSRSDTMLDVQYQLNLRAKFVQEALEKLSVAQSAANKASPRWARSQHTIERREKIVNCHQKNICFIGRGKNECSVVVVVWIMLSIVLIVHLGPCCGGGSTRKCAQGKNSRP